MTAKSSLQSRTRNCPACGEVFLAAKASQKRTYCSHSCAFSVIGSKVRDASKTPSAVAKMAASLRERGSGKSYRKFMGQHEHRVVAEQIIGRALLPEEVAHHLDLNPRNNSRSNIEVMTRSDHTRLHMKGIKRQLKMTCSRGHSAYVGPRAGAKSRVCIECQKMYSRRAYELKLQRKQRSKLSAGEQR